MHGLFIWALEGIHILTFKLNLKESFQNNLLCQTQSKDEIYYLQIPTKLINKKYITSKIVTIVASGDHHKAMDGVYSYFNESGAYLSSYIFQK